MFGRDSHSKETSPSVNTPEGLKASKVYADLVAGLQAENANLRATNRRTWLISAVLTGGFIGMAFTRKRVPYFLEVDGTTGRVAASNRTAEEFKPKENNISYFIREWVYLVILMNASTLKESLPKAITWTRGAATNELDDWILNVDKTASRMSTTSGLSREIVGTPTVSYNESGKVAFVDVIWLERVNGVEIRRQRKLLTLEFGFVEDMAVDIQAKNPLGLAITHFTISDQITR